DLGVSACLRGWLAHDTALRVEPGLDRIGVQSLAKDGADVVMKQTAVQQLPDEEAHAAGGVEMVHVGKSVRIDARQERNDVGEFRNVLPGQMNASCACHGDEVQGMIGRSAGGMEADDAVDDGSLVDHLS